MKSRSVQFQIGKRTSGVDHPETSTLSHSTAVTGSRASAPSCLQMIDFIVRHTDAARSIYDFQERVTKALQSLNPLAKEARELLLVCLLLQFLRRWGRWTKRVRDLAVCMRKQKEMDSTVEVLQLDFQWLRAQRGTIYDNMPLIDATGDCRRRCLETEAMFEILEQYLFDFLQADPTVQNMPTSRPIRKINRISRDLYAALTGHMSLLLKQTAHLNQHRSSNQNLLWPRQGFWPQLLIPGIAKTSSQRRSPARQVPPHVSEDRRPPAVAGHAEGKKVRKVVRFVSDEQLRPIKPPVTVILSSTVGRR